jgi:transposase
MANKNQTQPRIAAVGIDLGDVWGHYCSIDDQGERIDEGRVKMTRRALSNLLEELPPTRVAIEAGSQSLWVSEYLAGMGHEVLVANVRELRAITDSDRKHDRADAEKLARYARVDPRILRPVKHRSSLSQADLVLIRSRATLVETRTRLSNTARSLVKPFGYRLPPISVSGYAIEALEHVPDRLKAVILPLLTLIDALTKQITAFDKEIEQLADSKYPESLALRQIHGVGALTALTFVLTLEDKHRFKKSRDAGCFLGLRPRRSQSGRSDPQLGITKAGDGYLRTLLVQCAHHILGPFGPPSALQMWGRRLAEHGGKNGRRRAVVAVARKLAVLLHRLWVSQDSYEPLRGVAVAA